MQAFCKDVNLRSQGSFARLRYDLRTFGRSSVGSVGPEGEELLIKRCKDSPWNPVAFSVIVRGTASDFVADAADAPKEQAEIDLRNMQAGQKPPFSKCVEDSKSATTSFLQQVQLRRILQKERKVRGVFVTQASQGGIPFPKLVFASLLSS